MVPPTRIELVMTGYQPIVIPFNYRGIIWNAEPDSNWRFCGFAIHCIGPLCHRRIFFARGHSLCRLSLEQGVCSSARLPSKLGVPPETRTPTNDFGDHRAAITPERYWCSVRESNSQLMITNQLLYHLINRAITYYLSYYTPYVRAILGGG